MKRRPSPIGLKLTGKYGTAEIVRFNGPWRIHVYRPHVVPPNEPWNAAVYERVMAVDVYDGSEVHDKSHGGHERGHGYDADCSCCYLNITHTHQKHLACIGVALAAYTAHAKR